MPINDGRVPGPDATAVTDESGVYTLTVLTWTLEALANSSSEQVMLPALEVAPPVTMWGREEVAIDGFHHLVYATATGISYELLSSRR